MWNPYQDLPSGTRRGLGIGSVSLVLVIWAVLSGLSLVAKAKLPAPWECIDAFIQLAWDANKGESLLMTATLTSMARVLVAGFVVCLVGIPLGVLMGASPKVNAALSPMVDPFRSAPIVAIQPVVIMWFGIDELSKIIFLFLGAVVYLIPMVRDAVQAVPSTYYISARDLGASPWEAIRHAVLPIAMPRIADGVIVSISVMWTYITVAEYVNADAGLGQLIQNAKRFSSMPKVFVGIFVIIALALATYAGMSWLKKKLFPWELA
jgi:ABC-type nitrate/sulfonate/bicarbonate transport system permease component